MATTKPLIYDGVIDGDHAVAAAPATATTNIQSLLQFGRRLMCYKHQKQLNNA